MDIAFIERFQTKMYDRPLWDARFPERIIIVRP